MQNKPVNLLFREDLKPEDFNDDTIGRALDRLFENDPTKIFMQIAFKTANVLGISRKFLHLDSTTISVQGEYNFEDTDQIPIRITKGHAKNKRYDLNQFVVSLITGSQADFPFWMEVLSGNTSDKTQFREVIEKFSRDLAENGEETYFVMDSAMYSEKNVKVMSPLVKWISRIPETIKEAKQLIEKISINEMEESGLEGYRFKEFVSSYGGVEQKWLVIFSEKGYAKEMATLIKNIKKERAKIEKELWHFGNNEFNCLEDGFAELKKMKAKWRYHRTAETDVLEVAKTGKRGRPKKDLKDLRKVYKIKVSFEEDAERISSAESRKGKFIIATNDVEMDGNEALREYKDQQSVERGFRFLKDPLFFTSSVFLKKPSRIVSLGMIMVLSLLVYSVAQFKLRKALKENDGTIPDQKGKATSRPTMRWVFQIFEGIHLLVESGGGASDIVGILNIRDVHRKILSLLGESYGKMYLC